MKRAISPRRIASQIADSLWFYLPRRRRRVLLRNQYLHPKNLGGLRLLAPHLNFDYTESDDQRFSDIVYAPSRAVEQHSRRQYIFGPHFSVLPDPAINPIDSRNAVYIQPSPWAVAAWESVSTKIRLHTQSFPVDTEVFNEERPLASRLSSRSSQIFIYYKRRQPRELAAVESLLHRRKMEYQVFDYTRKYKESDYIYCLKQAKFGIVVGCHESQGFAIEEALSCNVPLLVWNVSSMNQEYGYSYPDIPATSIPYWDQRCGMDFHRIDQMEEAFDAFVYQLDSFRPREFVLANLSARACAASFEKLIHSI